MTIRIIIIKLKLLINTKRTRGESIKFNILINEIN